MSKTIYEIKLSDTITGLTNKTWDPDNVVSGRAATEDQVAEVANKATTPSGWGVAKTGTLSIAGAAAIGVTVDISDLGFEGPDDYTVFALVVQADTPAGTTSPTNIYVNIFDKTATSFKLKKATATTYDIMYVVIGKGYGGGTEYRDFPTIDDTLDDYSTNPVQNKAIKAYIDDVVIPLKTLMRLYDFTFTTDTAWTFPSVASDSDAYKVTLTLPSDMQPKWKIASVAKYECFASQDGTTDRVPAVVTYQFSMNSQTQMRIGFKAARSASASVYRIQGALLLTARSET